VRALAASLLLFLAAPSAIAAEKNEFKIDYFIVRGTTIEQLRVEANSRGPVGSSGRRGEANTRSNIAWRFQIRQRAAVCTVHDIEVDLTIRMILPKWEHPLDVDPDLLAHWNRYLTALRIHEDGHRNRAEGGAREVREALVDASGPGSCVDLKNRLDSKVKTQLAELGKRQADYDRETGNGKTQGVWLPEHLPFEPGADDGR
jgi:predicted secreted Zn-dependent protease